jgi:hypothetical protein
MQVLTGSETLVSSVYTIARSHTWYGVRPPKFKPDVNRNYQHCNTFSGNCLRTVWMRRCNANSANDDSREEGHFRQPGKPRQVLNISKNSCFVISVNLWLKLTKVTI